MKRQDKGSDGDASSFDDKYLEFVLIAPNAMLVAVFCLSWIVSKFVKRSKREGVDGEEGAETTRDRVSSSVYDIFSGLRKSFGWDKETPITIEDGKENGIELGNVYSAGEGGITNSNNPIHTLKRPSGVPLPPLDWDGYEQKEFKGLKKKKIREVENMNSYLRSVSGGD